MTDSFRHHARLSRRLTRQQRIRRAARIARRLHDSPVRSMRQVSTERSNRSWFARLMNAPARFTFGSFSALFDGNRLARRRDERSIVTSLRRAAARLMPQKAA